MNVVFAAANTTVTAPNGGMHTLTKGDPWDADDELVRRFPNLFTSAPPRVRTHRGWVNADDQPSRSASSPVETATAAPGEVRNVTSKEKRGGESK